MYLHGSSNLKFYTATFQKKSMIHETLFLRHESPCLPLKILKLLKKRVERSNNEQKKVIIFRQIFSETLGALMRLLGITKA